jgi:membrane associated rhomboid family serine protease
MAMGENHRRKAKPELNKGEFMKSVILFLLILFSLNAVAQQVPGALTDRPKPALVGQVPGHLADQQPWSQDLVMFLSVSVLSFCCLILIMATILLWRVGAAPQQVLRIFGVIAIIALSALLLVVGYNNEQLTPIVGLFGAISGYLLGKDPKASRDG